MPARAKRLDGTIDDGLTLAKVNVMSLAAEAKLNRIEANKAKARNRKSVAYKLDDHRRGHLRREARAANLAYAFLKGRDYKQVEAKCHEIPDWQRVERKIIQFGATRSDDESWQETQSRLDALRAQFKEWKL